MTYTDSGSPPGRPARLKPNVKGCGYPPTTDCTRFAQQFSPAGTNFSCWRSQLDPGLAITRLKVTTGV